jgi:acyl carrier protein
MREQVIRILRELLPDVNIEEGMDFIKLGVIDSFDVVRIVATLDEYYGISIDGLDVVPENFATVDTIVELLKKNGIRP